MNRFIPVLLFLFFVIQFSFTGCHNVVEKPPMAVPEVVLEEVQIREVQPYITATGYTEAYEFVQIPARVSGFLKEIRYEPGSIVKPGDPLFLIEPDQYQAMVNAAKAQLASAEAQLKLAQANLGRTKTLIPTGAMTEQDLETDQAKADVAAAAVLQAQADLETAELNLSYTDVRSPITGKVDKNFLSIGNMVGPAATSNDGKSHGILTTVAGMDPIYVYFDISDYQFNRMRDFAKEKQEPAVMLLIEELEKLKREREDEKAKAQGTPVPTTAQAETKVTADDLNVAFEVAIIKGAEPRTDEYPFKGIIDMTSNVIEYSTGTITIRGEIPNGEYTIFPGQICRVRIPLWKFPDAVLVRQEGIGTDLNQNYVYVVGEKNTAHRRVVELGMTQPDGTRVVTKGLEKGERYVVSGIQKVRDGAPVKAKQKEQEQKEPGAVPPDSEAEDAKE